MSEEDSGESIQKQVQLFKSISEEFVERDDQDLRRSENVQILIALGILGLAGTLVAQNLITFPLLEGASESSLVRGGFRLLVYSTILFLSAKLFTSALYPGSENRLLILLHEWVEPFGYIFFSSLFGIIVFLVIVSQNTPLSFGNLLVTLIAVVPSGYIAYKYTRRRADVYENMREAEAHKIRIRILWNLLNQHAWGSGIDQEKLVNWATHDESKERTRAVLNMMLSEDDALVEKDNGKISLTDKYDAVDVLKHNGIPERELRAIVPDYTKSSPTANPADEDERIFYCPDCKIRFAESEMSALQVEHRECPECARGMQLLAGPGPRRS